MNAMEHGNRYQPNLGVLIQVAESRSAVRVRITDHEGDRPIPETTAPTLMPSWQVCSHRAAGACS